MREIFERFDKYMKLKGLNDNRVTVDCGLSVGLIGQARSGKSDLGKRTTEKILRKYQDINRVWLLTGEGEMLTTQQAAASGAPSTESNIVPLLPVEAIAGFAIGVADPVELRDCRKVQSPVPGADFAIQISGDSMEPALKSGSIIYIKRINEKAFIPWGCVVVLDTENGVLVKEIYPHDKNEEYIEARSINPRYPPYEIATSGIYGIYRILGSAYINSTM